MNMLLIFLTGLTSGGLSCLAMQGGLLASVIANQKKTGTQGSAAERQQVWQSVALFLGSKLVAHTIFGFLLGMLGSVFALSLGVRVAFQTLAGLFMAATAANLLQLHPIFRYVAFQPPKVVRRYVYASSKTGETTFAPVLLGALTVFIPCGVTQAMYVTAMNSGSGWYGAVVLFAFVLGTLPLFALVGGAAGRVTEQWQQRFTRVAAVILIGMAAYSLNGVLVVLDSPITVQSLTRPITHFFSADRFAPAVPEAPLVDGVQQVTITVLDAGYSPNYIRVKAGIPVLLTLQSTNVYTCALSFVFREFGIQTFLDSTDSQSFTFTPTKPGKYVFACSMGMYSGVLEVQ